MDFKDSRLHQRKPHQHARHVIARDSINPAKESNFGRSTKLLRNPLAPLSNVTNILRNTGRSLLNKNTTNFKSRQVSGKLSTLQPKFQTIAEEPIKLDNPNNEQRIKIYNTPEEKYINQELPKIDQIQYHEKDLKGIDVVDINFDYLHYLESEFSISNEYMDLEKIADGDGKPLKLVSERMRIILLDWLINCGMKLELRNETMFLGVAILDSYIDICNTPSKRKHFLKTRDINLTYVTKANLQVTGLTAFVIASKYEEVTFPILEDWRYLSDHSVSCEDIKSQELKMLHVLDFKINFPIPLTFLRRFSSAARADARQHRIARYFLETMFYDKKLSKLLPSEKAAVAIYLSLKMSEKGDNSVWTKELRFYSRVEEKWLQEPTRWLCQLIVRTVNSAYSNMQLTLTKHTSKSHGTAVFRKYSQPEKLPNGKTSATAPVATDKRIFIRLPGPSIQFNRVIRSYAE